MESKTTNDPENYYKLSEPFENPKVCNEALTKFHDELAELRKKHKIRDLLIISYGSVKDKEGATSDFLICNGFGNSLNQLPMAAFAYGQMKAENIERINQLLAGNTKNTK